VRFFILFFLLFLSLNAQSFNHLIDETSPYLKQHSHNPVNWYPWGKEALLKAKKEHKMIFLSIGYSTCHWCHVMAHESFENKKIAKLLNDDFISIKVDREELPHLDKYYQNLYVLLKKRSGGWPLTAILTEDAQAFFIGTYIPANDTYTQEGLTTILPFLATFYKENTKAIILKAKSIKKEMLKADADTLKPIKIDLGIKKDIYKGLEKQFDINYYGFSKRPKFPESSKLSLLFDLDELGVKGAQNMALKTLRAMALHGIYDQVDGGFFRYSVDEAWEIPHFEKMLYTNAELIPLYVKAYEITKDDLYKNIVIETIDMIENRFLSKGVYYSASDADSEHEEGGFFIYSYEQILKSMKSLSKKEKEQLLKDLDISEDGNFEEKIHLNFYTQVRAKNFAKIKKYLKNLRKSRTYPFIDKKINTAWNSMMIESLFLASKIDVKYKVMAENRIKSLISLMYKKGVLYHQTIGLNEPSQKALLEDYAFLISTLIVAYEKTYNQQYLFLAKQFTDIAVKKFYKDESWFLSDDSLNVKADMLDKYYMAPMNKMLINLLKIASLSGKHKYLTIVQKSLDKKSNMLNENPSFYPSAMRVLLREKKGFITLKASTENLKNNFNKISNIRYPFVLTKAKEFDKYLACDMNQCFAIDKELNNVIKLIEYK